MRFGKNALASFEFVDPPAALRSARSALLALVRAKSQVDMAKAA
jgi:hypothetical protein